MSIRICPICDEKIEGRVDKKHCSDKCKKVSKAAYDKDRYSLNRNTIISKASEYNILHKEDKRLYDMEYRKIRDKKKRYEWDCKFRLENPEYGRLKQARRRAAKLSQGVYSVSQSELHRLVVHYLECCAYCSQKYSKDNPLEWDHVVPISRGGTHSIGNLLPSCRKCNRSKADRLVIEWKNKVSSPRYK